MFRMLRQGLCAKVLSWKAHEETHLSEALDVIVAGGVFSRTALKSQRRRPGFVQKQLLCVLWLSSFHEA